MTGSESSKHGGQATDPQMHPGSECTANPARFKLIYESADGRFCLFEDHEGHLTSVRSSKLA